MSKRDLARARCMILLDLLLSSPCLIRTGCGRLDRGELVDSRFCGTARFPLLWTKKISNIRDELETVMNGNIATINRIVKFINNTILEDESLLSIIILLLFYVRRADYIDLSLENGLHSTNLFFIFSFFSRENTCNYNNVKSLRSKYHWKISLLAHQFRVI